MRSKIVLLLWVIAPALLVGQHVPPCGGARHSNHTICYAYAQGRAFGAQWSGGDCELQTLLFNYIDDRFFASASLSMPEDIKLIQTGDILDFNGSHYAYVTSIGSQTPSTVRLAQVNNEWGNEQPDLALETVRVGDVPNGVTARGWPTARWYLRPVFKVKVFNDFAAGYVKVGGVTAGSGYEKSGMQWKEPVSIEAVANGTDYNGYVKQFDQWNKGTGWFSDSPTPSAYPDGYSPDYPTEYTAIFNNALDATFTNSRPGTGAGSITVRNLVVSAPYATTTLASDRHIQSMARDSTIASIDYSFSYWTNDANSDTVRSRDYTFYVSSNHTTYTAQFAAKPYAPTNVQAGGTVGQHVVITWQDIGNSSVHYWIYRQRKNEDPVHVGTVDPNEQQWTDPDCIVTGTASDEWLTYTVYTEYYGSFSDPSAQVKWATYEPTRFDDKGIRISEEGAIPLVYQVGNYPNPFNPSTTISYNIPKDASVKLDIFDLMGRKLKSLLDGSRSAGYYSVVWNGRDESGKDVSSGMYVYQFVATPSDGDKQFKQSGKLMLTR